MKYLILMATLAVINYHHVAAQDTTVAKTKEYYLQKSKSQKTTAWVFLGVGAAAVITGAIVGTSLKEEDDLNTGFDKMATGGGIMLAGTVSCLVSIPFFISASKNKRKAMALSTGFQQIPIPVKSLAIKQPGIALSITIGR